MEIVSMSCKRSDQITLTSNRRLANFLLKEYDAESANDKKVWVSPKIYPISEWIEKLWRTLTPNHPRLLNDFQEQLIWSSLIQNEEWSLINIAKTAELAKQAWKTLHLWDIAVEQIEPLGNEEVETFIRWAKKFKDKCRENDWITTPEIPKKLLAIFEENKNSWMKLPEKILLCGFDELPPIYQKILDSHSLQSNYQFFEKNLKATSIRRLELADPSSEIETMARWAKSQNQKFPDHKIGCIVPELSSMRAVLEKTFIDIFNSEDFLFNISSGKALIQFDLIQSAYSILKLMLGKLEIKNTAHLFQSPYLSLNDCDKTVGALLDIQLKSYHNDQLPLFSVFKPLETLAQRFPNNTWIRRFQKLLSFYKGIPKYSLASDWTNYFSECLIALGWPGARTLNSLEYQLLKRFEKLLLEFSSLDFLNEISLPKALSIFHRLALQTIFQPQTKNNPPIQVLGILEAAGCYFDDLWVMGLNDEAWPPPAHPNPFLPYSLQVAHNMPHANAHRELTYTAKLHQRLLSSANFIILSSSKIKEDRECRASKLITSFPIIQKNDLSLQPYISLTNHVYQSKKMEYLEDVSAPPIRLDEYLSGGSAIIKEQSACPFRAFARYRLDAKPLEKKSLGLSASQRGILLHSAMEKVWREIKDHSTLIQLKENNLEIILKNISNQVIQEFLEKEPFFPSTKLLEIEKNRLKLLILKWLSLERERPPFSVLQRETRESIQVNQLPLSIQIDRIDELENGNKIIIDYKTSDPSINVWFGDRPQDPQLPLYCVFANSNNISFSGISFAIIRADKMEMKGIKQEYKKDGMNWEDLKNHWKIRITQLANEFYKGTAKVDPRDKNTCQYCHLQSVCRIHAS